MLEEKIILATDEEGLGEPIEETNEDTEDEGVGSAEKKDEAEKEDESDESEKTTEL